MTRIEAVQATSEKDVASTEVGVPGVDEAVTVWTPAGDLTGHYAPDGRVIDYTIEPPRPRQEPWEYMDHDDLDPCNHMD